MHKLPLDGHTRTRKECPCCEAVNQTSEDIECVNTDNHIQPYSECSSRSPPSPSPTHIPAVVEAAVQAAGKLRNSWGSHEKQVGVQFLAQGNLDKDCVESGHQTRITDKLLYLPNPSRSQLGAIGELEGVSIRDVSGLYDRGSTKDLLQGQLPSCDVMCGYLYE